jgi:hypothetical protein
MEYFLSSCHRFPHVLKAADGNFGSEFRRTMATEQLKTEPEQVHTIRKTTKVAFDRLEERK